MTFHVFERIDSNGEVILRSTNELFSLAGHNLIYKAWEKRKKPLDEGWHVAADELVNLYSDGSHTLETRRLVIDFHPKALRRIGLVEIVDIHAFTWPSRAGDAEWTPLLIKMRDVFYQEYDSDFTQEMKSEVFSSVNERTSAEEFVEFLYLKGPAWNWGKNGMTNAAFLYGKALEYFRRHF